jgi:hypothetical protein
LKCIVDAVVVLTIDAFSIFTAGTTGAGVLSFFLLHDKEKKLDTTNNERSIIFCSIYFFYRALKECQQNK